MLAIDPSANVRIFDSSDSASVAALRWRGGGGIGDPTGIWIAFDGAGPRIGELASVARHDNGRRNGWVAGKPEDLRAALEIDPEWPARGDALSALEHYLGLRASRSPTLVMGILNLTPDSFSDGGRFTGPGAAVECALGMTEDGADILDLGGESTRPGATDVPPDEELARVLPVLRALRPLTRARLSIDTRKAVVAEACLDAGADWINDVSGLAYDPRMASVVAAFPHAKLVVMHSTRSPSRERFSTAYSAEDAPAYEDVVADSLRWLRGQIGGAIAAGVRPEQLWIDPGFGFGKSFADNVAVLQRLREYASIGCPVLVGTSRKSTVGKLLGDAPPEARLEGTAATVAWCAAHGAAAVRVHEVKEMARIAHVTDILRGVPGAGPNPCGSV